MAIEVQLINKVREKVKEHKVKTGETQAHLANRIGIEKQALNNAFNARKALDFETLAKLSVAMYCDISDLVEIKRISVE